MSQQPNPTTPPTTPEVKPEDGKSAEPKATEPKPAEVEPLTFEKLTMPEGLEVDQPTVDKFLEILNDAKLTPGDRANKLVALQAEVAKGQSEKVTAAFNDFQSQQQDEVRADPDVGGARLDGVLSNISTLLNTYGSPEVREVFSVTGAGNNVHMVKFLSKMAAALNEGKPVPGAPGGGATSLESKLYPSMSKGN